MMSKKRANSDIVQASPMTRMAQEFGETLPEGQCHSQSSVRTSQVYCTPEYLSLDFCTPTDEQGLKTWSQEAAQVSKLNFIETDVLSSNSKRPDSLFPSNL
jgi:hypothetical protein